MFRFLCKNRSFFVTIPPIHGPSSLFSPLRYISSCSNDTSDRAFVVSYLVRSCGLSLDSAQSASIRIHFETPDKSDSVISLLKNHGFSQTQISSMIIKHPYVLISKPERTLLPKLEFFYSIGLSSSEMCSVVSRCPFLLWRSLKNRIIPTYELVKALLHPDQRVTRLIRRFPRILIHNLQTSIVPTINCFREDGLPGRIIAEILFNSYFTFVTYPDKIKKAVKEAFDMGFNPSSVLFAEAVASFALNPPVWKSKVNVCKRWGWSDEEVISAFKMFPRLILKSEDKIMGVMSLFVRELGWESSYIAKRPGLIAYSLEKKLIPRASVLKFLLSRGLVKKDFRNENFFKCPEGVFLQMFVNCYNEAPELLKLYNEKLALSKESD